MYIYTKMYNDVHIGITDDTTPKTWIATLQLYGDATKKSI
jgi:hypothetical protein